MDAAQILWLIIDIVMGIAIFGGFVVILVIAVLGRSGSTSKKPKKKEKPRKS